MTNHGVITNRQPLLGWIANDEWCMCLWNEKMVDALRLSNLHDGE